MKVLPAHLINSNNLYNSKQKKKEYIMQESNIQHYSPLAYPSNYYLSFGARVDKGLERFYQQNKDVMPTTVKSYIESLSDTDKQTISPLQAQANAFEYLTICDSVDDVKDIYGNEPLFENLKKSTDTRATRGLLYDIRLMSEDIKADGEFVVKGEEDLTLYLLKKVYLESKTIAEINEDLDADLNPVFQNDDKNYVSSSTLAALGIKLPKNEYLTSLRYTRDGYADKMGQVISDRWASLSEEEKMSRIDALLSAPRNLSPEKAKQLSEKRSQMMKERWAKLSAAQKVELIERLKTGNEDEKLAMINAWNNCTDVRDKLSDHFLNANFHNVGNILYSNKPFSQSMHDLMTEFWDKNRDCADMLGEAIRTSYVQIQDAKSNDNFEEFMSSVLDRQQELKKEMNAKKLVKKEELELKRNVINEFMQTYLAMFSFLPQDYLQSYFACVDELPEEIIKLWTKKYSGQKLTPEENKIYSEQSNIVIDNDDFRRKNQAVKLAMVNVIKKCLIKTSSLINNPDFHTADFRILSSILIHVLKGNSKTTVKINGNMYALDIYRKPKASELNNEYKNYLSKISKQNADLLYEKLIIGVDIDKEQEQNLKQYLASLPNYYSEILYGNFCSQKKDELIYEIVIDFPDIKKLGCEYRDYLAIEEIKASKQMLKDAKMNKPEVISYVQSELLKKGYNTKQIMEMMKLFNS